MLVDTKLAGKTLMRRIPETLFATALAAALMLAACGGGSGSVPADAQNVTLSGANPGSASSGTVTAFGSIFVNGHEFATGSAKVIDDDAGTTSSDASTLEVGMSVDVIPAPNSSPGSPVAGEIHLRPLVRGTIDGSDSNAGTLTVMGQTVQLSATTNFSDHRACLTAASPCTPVTGQADLAVTSGGAAGSYVTVHGFLFNSGTGGGANVVASLVSVGDVPTAPTSVAYKVEGAVASVSASGITIGGLTLDLSAAQCVVAKAATPCAAAFSTGQVVSAVSATAPSLPATTFTPTTARLRSALVVQAPGSAIELEGKVSSVTTSPAAFVLRGISVDASALTSGSLPAVGDVVEVLGSIASDGKSVTGSTVKVLHTARSATFGFEGDATSVVAGSSANTWVLSLLGQAITVTSTTRLADRSPHGSMGQGASTSNPFNISTFQTYLAASASQHLVVRTQADGNGNLSALSVTLVPASSVASVGGTVDATPAPVNGTPVTFSLHGLAVSADPSALVGSKAEHDEHGFGGMSIAPQAVSVKAGDLVLVRGTYAAGTLTVAAGSGSPTKRTNVVIDFGVSNGHDHDGF
jgi:hypothetical protein